MHAFGKALFLTLLSLHWHLALAQAPTSTPPPVPTFQSTPGIVVEMPRNGMTVRQDVGVPFNVILASGRAIGSISASIAHVDGSANTTILDLNQVALYRVLQLRNNSLSTFPPGDYHIQIIAVPSLSAPTLKGAPTAPAAAVPTSPVSPSIAPAVYYWKGLIRLALPEESSNLSSAASTLGQGAALVGTRVIWINMNIALGVLFLAFMFTF
ncbi:unnamed protein product [Mortierella alpina]